MFPLNPISYDVETRHREKFQVTKCKTTRLQNSAIPFMQNLLNSEKLWKSITVKHWFKKWNFVFVLKTYHFNNKPLSLKLELKLELAGAELGKKILGQKYVKSKVIKLIIW